MKCRATRVGSLMRCHRPLSPLHQPAARAQSCPATADRHSADTASAAWVTWNELRMQAAQEVVKKNVGARVRCRSRRDPCRPTNRRRAARHLHRRSPPAAVDGIGRRESRGESRLRPSSRGHATVISRSLAPHPGKHHAGLQVHGRIRRMSAAAETLVAQINRFQPRDTVGRIKISLAGLASMAGVCQGISQLCPQPVLVGGTCPAQF